MSINIFGFFKYTSKNVAAADVAEDELSFSETATVEYTPINPKPVTNPPSTNLPNQRVPAEHSSYEILSVSQTSSFDLSPILASSIEPLSHADLPEENTNLSPLTINTVVFESVNAHREEERIKNDIGKSKPNFLEVALKQESREDRKVRKQAERKRTEELRMQKREEKSRKKIEKQELKIQKREEKLRKKEQKKQLKIQKREEKLREKKAKQELKRKQKEERLQEKEARKQRKLQQVKRDDIGSNSEDTNIGKAKEDPVKNLRFGNKLAGNCDKIVDKIEVSRNHLVQKVGKISQRFGSCQIPIAATKRPNKEKSKTSLSAASRYLKVPAHYQILHSSKTSARVPIKSQPQNQSSAGTKKGAKNSQLVRSGNDSNTGQGSKLKKFDKVLKILKKPVKEEAQGSALKHDPITEAQNEQFDFYVRFCQKLWNDASLSHKTMQNDLAPAFIQSKLELMIALQNTLFGKEHEIVLVSPKPAATINEQVTSNKSMAVISTAQSSSDNVVSQKSSITTISTTRSLVDEMLTPKSSFTTIITTEPSTDNISMSNITQNTISNAELTKNSGEDLNNNLDLESAPVVVDVTCATKLAHGSFAARDDHNAAKTTFPKVRAAPESLNGSINIEPSLIEKSRVINSNKLYSYCGPDKDHYSIANNKVSKANYSTVKAAPKSLNPVDCIAQVEPPFLNETSEVLNYTHLCSKSDHICEECIDSSSVYDFTSDSGDFDGSPNHGSVATPLAATASPINPPIINSFSASAYSEIKIGRMNKVQQQYVDILEKVVEQIGQDERTDSVCKRKDKEE
ncbi:hypothetical protein DASC09_004360 [Saccharomycopsis crataegensis]|uniref:Uncharacterized protein n=1 Tax=Saccharomycopsis crataegensis TaxID=43959 RepID=A0AAV5QED9_9ASCO|nr:hypothetical protein DASC09_004360 [Saccharomycopsis crataegensis]